MKTLKVSIVQVQRKLVDVLRGLGYNGNESKQIAEEFIDNEIIGKERFGLKVFNRLVKYDTNKKKTPVKIMKTGNTAIIDAGGRFSHAVAEKALDLLTKAAKKGCIGLVGIKNNTSVIKAGYFVHKLLKKKLIGICLIEVNSRFSSPEEMARPLFGTNPIAIGIPCGKHDLIYDSSTTKVSGGALAKMIEERRLFYEPRLGYDIKGRYTNNPKEVVSVLPIGGNKGFGLLLAVELLAGSLLGYEVQNKKETYIADNGTLLIAIDPTKLANLKSFEGRNERLLDLLKKESGRKLHIPGERYERLNQKGEFLYIDEDLAKEIGV